MTISFFILNLVNALAMIYAESKLLDKNINFKSKRFYISLIVLTAYMFFAYLITKSAIRVVILLQVYNACNIYTFYSKDENIKKITFNSVISYIILILAEVIAALGISLLFSIFINLEKTNAYNNNVISYAIILIYVLILNIKPIKKFLQKISNYSKSSKSYNVIFFVMYVFIILVTTLYLIYFDLSQPLKLALFIFSFVEYMFATNYFLINYRNKEKVQRELDLMIEVSSQYEEVINDIRIKNHENKNQLIVVKDLIGNNDKKAKKYIDNMINIKYKDDNELIFKVANIPAGGLKGLVYYKLLTMKSKKIYCYLNVDKNINKNVFENINSNLIQSFYKIVGVFLDNAIEAVVETKGKKKIISIEIYLEDEFFILTVSNEYSNLIDLDKIGKQKITSKGEGHGYGLQLVQEIVESNKEIIHETNIIGNLFVQKVGIKISKKASIN